MTDPEQHAAQRREQQQTEEAEQGDALARAVRGKQAGADIDDPSDSADGEQGGD